MSDKQQSEGQTQNVSTKKPWYKKWWVITIGVIVIFVIIGNMSSDEEKTKSQPQQTETKREEPAKETEKSTPEVTVTSATMSKDYSENEVSADAKYKGKLIEISGKVTGVDNGTFDNEMIVKLSDGEYDFSGPWCYMKASEKVKVLELKKGQEITLIGTGDSATIGSPIIKKCVIK